MQKERNSAYELLRILCILGILYMHLLGEYGPQMSESTRMLRIVSDSIFNAGVSCFMLLSGYFGIRFNLKKLIRLDLMAIGYSLLGLAIKYFLHATFGMKEILTCLFPIISGKYWFLSCYVFIAILAPFIEKGLKSLSQREHRNLIGILLILFYVVPTFLYFQFLNDNGKGLVNLITVYIIGRYIGLYIPSVKTKRWRLWGAFMINLIVIVDLNAVTTFLTGKLSTIWSRDCSLFILLSALLLFAVFSTMRCKSRVINRIAGSVLAVYVASPYMQMIFEKWINFERHDGTWYLGLLLLLLALLSFVSCVIIDIVRSALLGRVEGILVECIERPVRYGIKYWENCSNKWSEHE